MPCKDRTLPNWITRFQKNLESTLPETEEMEDDKKKYCFGKKPWEGCFMIQCDYCDNWYHGSCVNVTATGALDIDRYKSKVCK
jgi:hypothetical protein